MSNAPKPPIHHLSDGGHAIAATLAKRGVVQVKQAIPLRRMISITTDAIETFMRRRPDFLAGNGMDFGEDVSQPSPDGKRVVRLNPNLFRAICFGPIGQVINIYFKNICGVGEAILPVASMVIRRYDPGQRNLMLPFHQDQVTFLEITRI
jgi:hypothetical protein